VFSDPEWSGIPDTTRLRRIKLTASIDRYILSPYAANKGALMPLIIITFLVSILKYFEVWRFAELSWWWVAGLVVVSFIWFEFLEKLLGLDKSRAHDEQDRIRRERVKKNFEQQNKSNKR
jgi:small Trp-rich protein